MDFFHSSVDDDRRFALCMLTNLRDCKVDRASRLTSLLAAVGNNVVSQNHVDLVPPRDEIAVLLQVALHFADQF